MTRGELAAKLQALGAPRFASKTNRQLIWESTDPFQIRVLVQKWNIRGRAKRWRVTEELYFRGGVVYKSSRYVSDEDVVRYAMESLQKQQEFHDDHYGHRVSHCVICNGRTGRANDICEDCEDSWTNGLGTLSNL